MLRCMVSLDQVTVRPLLLDGCFNFSIWSALRNLEMFNSSRASRFFDSLSYTHIQSFSTTFCAVIEFMLNSQGSKPQYVAFNVD